MGMATLSKREARTAAASVHARRGETCPCGRTVRGNGRIAHYRRCTTYLTQHGWPFTAAQGEIIARDARESLDEGMTATERVEAITRYMHEAAMSEARSRGLIP